MGCGGHAVLATAAPPPHLAPLTHTACTHTRPLLQLRPVHPYYVHPLHTLCTRTVCTPCALCTLCSPLHRLCSPCTLCTPPGLCTIYTSAARRGAPCWRRRADRDAPGRRQHRNAVPRTRRCWRPHQQSNPCAVEADGQHPHAHGQPALQQVRFRYINLYSRWSNVNLTLLTLTLPLTR